ncbi:putative bifunctional diguanylate cyclase/phosphodiesterase [Pseudoalteromonas sp. S16_S37]|uniref:putative bifunctional diguanylate cyclase/phosphodiesterase n=1 Tax=Pseudoalteromonas sp. S16_S37 TaxID=2720228 RepID=UPI0016818AAF|nr:EAL domain-containing protein [Pseudoalteromonas sp. S16_S37]MBD1581110.1 EAL domain-containing protein [Pseudoalteromonas sp. S16_S37]
MSLQLFYLVMQIEELIGLHIIHLIPPRFRDKHDLHFKQFLQAKDTQRKMGSRQEIYGYRKDGSEFPANASIAKTSSSGLQVLTVTIVDISEQKEQHEQLEWQANHDTLTHLPNRSLFHRRLSTALRRSHNTNTKVALLFIDLDHFKSINDIFGHDFGDMLLVSAANRLLGTINPGDTLSRFGGDEFVVLCDNVDDVAQVKTLAHKINQRLKEPFNVLDQIVYLSCSIGFSMGYGAYESANTLVRKADTAMYEAKDKGRDAILEYDPHLDSQMKNKFDIVYDLRRAINDESFSLVIQPIVDLSSNKVIAGEVLLRCTTPRGEISPAVFIPVAESIGLINLIGEWVIIHAFGELSKMSEHIDSGLLKYISINISNNQLCQPDFLKFITSELAKYDLSARHILLEITETSIMKNETHVKHVLAELAEIGFKIAIDDFGTGYTCFNQLLELPIDCLKIDKTFIDKLESDEKSPVLIHTISSLANFLGFDVITEGVETKEQLKTLHYLGCYRIQGYLFYKPMTFSEFEQLLAANESTKIDF